MGELLPDLIDECLNFKNGFYLECGANNGIRQSNTIFLEKYLGWKGILIEPNLKYLNQCKLHRSSENIFYGCALVSDEQTKTVFGNFDEDHGGEALMAMMDWNPDESLYEVGYIECIKDKFKTRKKVEVPAKTLQSILIENNIKHIDFISLDMEGYEYESLKHFNFSLFDINYILIEHGNRPKYEQIITDLMIKNNYNLYKKISINDNLYRKNNL